MALAPPPPPPPPTLLNGSRSCPSLETPLFPGNTATNGIPILGPDRDKESGGKQEEGSKGK